MKEFSGNMIIKYIYKCQLCGKVFKSNAKEMDGLDLLSSIISYNNQEKYMDKTVHDCEENKIGVGIRIGAEAEPELENKDK
jgi:cytidylate kinase